MKTAAGDVRDRVVDFRRIKASDLLPNPDNWRTHGKAQKAALAGVLKEIGFAGAVLTRRIGKRLQIIDGHLRSEMRADAEVPVLVTDLTEAEADKLMTVYDPIGALAGSNKQALAALLARVETEDDGLAALLAKLGKTTALVEDAEVPKPKDPKCKRGDLFILGEHRLMCGDSTKIEDLRRLMGNSKASLLVTDPPYGVSYAEKNAFLNAVGRGNCIQEPIENDHRSPEEMAKFWEAAFGAARSALADGAAYYVTGPQGGDLLLLLLLSLRASGFPLRHMLVWAKNNHVLGRSDYHYKHEPIAYGWVDGAHRFFGGKSEVSLWEIDKPQKSDLHPTMKPVELYARAYRNSSRQGEIVYEPFSGSGTALIAAEQLGRRCFAMEIDPGYVRAAVTRWEQFTGKKARLQRG